VTKTLDHWDGDPEELIGAEDQLLDDPDLCEELFASEHEALSVGFFLGKRFALLHSAVHEAAERPNETRAG
jgi:hypothetical protein